MKTPASPRLIALRSSVVGILRSALPANSSPESQLNNIKIFQVLENEPTQIQNL
jgi:hypothetical protein